MRQSDPSPPHSDPLTHQLFSEIIHLHDVALQQVLSDMIPRMIDEIPIALKEGHVISQQREVSTQKMKE